MKSFKFLLLILIAVVLHVQTISAEGFKLNLQKSKGFCCNQNKIVSIDRKSCDRQNGEFYTEYMKAQIECNNLKSGTKSNGFCCVNSHVKTSSQRVCLLARGTYFDNEEEARTACIDRSGFCCDQTHGVYESNESLCRFNNGQFYTDAARASDACGGQVRGIEDSIPETPQMYRMYGWVYNNGVITPELDKVVLHYLDSEPARRRIISLNENGMYSILLPAGSYRIEAPIPNEWSESTVIKRDVVFRTGDAQSERVDFRYEQDIPMILGIDLLNYIDPQLNSGKRDLKVRVRVGTRGAFGKTFNKTVRLYVPGNEEISTEETCYFTPEERNCGFILNLDGFDRHHHDLSAKIIERENFPFSLRTRVTPLKNVTGDLFIGQWEVYALPTENKMDIVYSIKNVGPEPSIPCQGKVQINQQEPILFDIPSVDPGEIYEGRKNNQTGRVSGPGDVIIHEVLRSCDPLFGNSYYENIITEEDTSEYTIRTEAECSWTNWRPCIDDWF